MGFDLKRYVLPEIMEEGVKGEELVARVPLNTF